MSQVSNRYCTEARGFDPSGQLPRYGLTCGYWTNVPKNLDNHVIKHHFDDDQCYDLFDSQYQLDKIMRAQGQQTSDQNPTSTQSAGQGERVLHLVPGVRYEVSKQ